MSCYVYHSDKTKVGYPSAEAQQGRGRMIARNEFSQLKADPVSIASSETDCKYNCGPCCWVRYLSQITVGLV